LSVVFREKSDNAVKRHKNAMGNLAEKSEAKIQRIRIEKFVVLIDENCNDQHLCWQRRRTTRKDSFELVASRKKLAFLMHTQEEYSYIPLSDQKLDVALDVRDYTAGLHSEPKPSIITDGGPGPYQGPGGQTPRWACIQIPRQNQNF
jgi:hypothetical protein